MLVRVPQQVGGYVLAGGKSSRMQCDKALLELGRKPLIEHAVKKLRRVCMDVRILSGNSELARHAPIVPDLHPDCGPMGGMEAALVHSAFEWNLFLPVDMPFLPSWFVDDSLKNWLGPRRTSAARIQMFTVNGRPQPGFCLLHKDVLPFLSAALPQGDFKLMRVFEAAGRELALRQGLLPEAGLWNVPMNVPMTDFPASRSTTEAQQAARHLWFSNLNTPEEFAEAERHVNALDT